MPIYTNGGVLLADGTSLKGCCCDEFTCGDSLEIAASGIANSSCSTCNNYNTTGEAISTTLTGSPCGLALTNGCVAIVQSYSSFDACYNLANFSGCYYWFVIGSVGSTRHAIVFFNAGYEHFGGFVVWHRTQGTDFTFPISFTAGDIDGACDRETANNTCDFSGATITVSVV